MKYFFAQNLKLRSYLIVANDEEEALKIAHENKIDGCIYELTPDKFDTVGVLITGER